MFNKVSVIGAGGWGTALAILLAESHGCVSLWSHNPAVAEEIARDGTNRNYLPDVTIPPQVTVTTRLDEVADADLLVMVVPSKALRMIARQLEESGIRAGAVIVSCTKGIEHDSGKLMSDVIAEEIPDCRPAVLSGPNLAREIARGIPAMAVIGSQAAEVLMPLQTLFSTRTFRTYTSDDVAGIQLGGALKNVFAIAAGASDGFGMGDNAKAGLVTRALAEMMRLGVALGGRRETFHGLSGVGDLMVTCFSEQSRNHKVGLRLGQGESPSEIVGSMKMVAEGVPTSRSALQCARRLGVEAPIIAEVYAVLHEGKSPKSAMWELLGRPPRAEAEQ